MGYREAIESTGAKVLAYEKFGTYDGEWLAQIEVDGEIKYIRDYFGECSSTDAFEADFGSESHECGDDIYYDPFYNNDGFRENCEKCQNLKKRFIKFGQDYVENAMSFDECMKIVSKNFDWDMEAKEMVDWLNNLSN